MTRMPCWLPTCRYITAAMLSRWVPVDGAGAKVIQLNGGTRELYYYPKNGEKQAVSGPDSACMQAPRAQALPEAAAWRTEWKHAPPPARFLTPQGSAAPWPGLNLRRHSHRARGAGRGPTQSAERCR